MTEKTFKTVFTRFLDGYWGAFHEALEAQGVNPLRLADSLFQELRAEHRAFEAVYAGPAEGALGQLGDIWSDVQTRRYQSPDPPLTHDHVARARKLFEDIFDSLLHEGEKYPAVCEKILKGAEHGTPREPLRADTAR